MALKAVGSSPISHPSSACCIKNRASIQAEARFFPVIEILRQKSLCGYSSSVEHQLPKLRRRVRFPLSAPRAKNLSVTSFLPLETAEAPTFLQSPNEASVRKQPPTSGTIVGFLQNHTFLPFPLPNFPFSTFNFQLSTFHFQFVYFRL